jgi:hypothetical protein
MSGRILSFKEFIRVNESDTTTVGANDEIIGKMFDTLFREGANAATYIQSEFSVLGSLLNAEVTNPDKDADYYGAGAFGSQVRLLLRQNEIGRELSPVKVNNVIIQHNLFVMLNSYLKYIYSKKASMVNVYGGEGKTYPNLTERSFDSLQRLLTDMGLTGDGVFGQYWKNYSTLDYVPGVLARQRSGEEY